MSLMQLALTSAVDDTFYKNPEISFFKSEYKRSSRFSTQQINFNLQNTPVFGQTATCTIIRSGDYMGAMYLHLHIGTLAAGSAGTVAWTPYLGYAIIKRAKVIVGAQTISTIYGRQMYIMNCLTKSSEKKLILANLLGNNTKYTSLTDTIQPLTLDIPLSFYFCERPAFFLPTASINYNQLSIEIDFESFSNLIVYTGGFPAVPTISDAKITTDVYYVTDAERMDMSKLSEVIVPQIFTSSELSVTGPSGQLNLNFTLPVAELYWVAHSPNAPKLLDFTNTTSADLDIGAGAENIVSTNFKINNSDRFTSDIATATYTNMIQPYQNHTAAGVTGIHSYSFALFPENSYPTGTLNFSKVANAQMSLTLSDSLNYTVWVFALGFNIIRNVSGTIGLVYSS